jgi:hypothetical protein
MRIACDLDGVLADLHEPFVRTATRLFPELDPGRLAAAEISAALPDDESPEEPTELVEGSAAAPVELPSLALTRRQADAVWKEIANTENFWEQLQEIEPGAIARLATLADERRWEVLFITSRPKSGGRTVQRQTQRWLSAQGFDRPAAYVVHGNRGRIADALHLDVVIDDRPDNCLDVVLESKAGAILVWRGSPESVPASARRLGIVVVSSVAECLDAIVQAEEAKTPGGFLRRLRAIFGLKTRPPSPFGR